MAKLADKMRKHPKIYTVYRDDDGWWLETRAGWAFDPALPPYGGCHTVSEDTLTELAKHIQEIQPCQCACCLKRECDAAMTIPNTDKGTIQDAIIQRITVGSDIGFCIKCGSLQYGCKTDARRRKCESCGGEGRLRDV